MAWLLREGSMKVITGARGTAQPGWQSFERSQLDIRDRAQWARLFPPNSIDAVLSEHVLEHLTFDEAIRSGRITHDESYQLQRSRQSN
jgi:predicted SAM-dependent methyltransferase